MKWIIRLYSLVLLAYTGWRTWDFINQQLPDNETGFYLAILFLFATEIGLVIWHEASLGHTTTYTQHGIATALTWVDFAGSLGAGLADMIIRQTISDYQVPEWLALALIFGLPAIVALNVAGAILYMQNDAESVEDRAERFLAFEATKQAIKDLDRNRSQLANARKAEIYQDITGKAFRRTARRKSAASNVNALDVEMPELPANPTPRRRLKKS